MKKYIIGLDSGTSGIKAVLFDLRGNELMSEGLPLTAICPKENWYEEDVREIWQKARECISGILRRYPAGEIAGIGITAQGDGLWMIDENGEPTRNGCCFCEGRSTEELEQWNNDGVIKKVFEISGTRMFTGNQPCIVKWMRNNEKETLDRTAYLMHLKDVLFFKLTGEATTDATDQSLVFLNMRTRDYDERLFKLYGLEEYRAKYPPIKTAMENKAVIKKELASELGLPDDLIVTSGPMDVVACALGAGVVQSGHCCSIMGTAALHEMVIDAACQDEIFAGMTVTHVEQDRVLRLMASLAGTPNIDWVIDTFGAGIKAEARQAGVPAYRYIEDRIARVPIGSNGVIYHPYLLAGGERAPFVDFSAKASFTGISVVTKIEDILRACYEGVAFAMLDCYNHMPQEIKKITLCGGGAKSDFWCRMFADVTGKQIVTIEGEELGARGAAITNAVAQGIYKDFETALDGIISTKSVYEPDMQNHEQYLKFYKLYKRTYEQLSETWKLRHEILFK